MSTEQAKTTERNAKGHFPLGNAGGPGNPFARKTADFRTAIITCTTIAHIQTVIHALYEQAAKGNVPAAKLYLQYTVGKPQPAPEPDRMDADEWDVYKEQTPMRAETAPVMAAGTPDLHLKTVRMLRPVVSYTMAKEMADMALETPEQTQAREDREAAEAEAMMNAPGPDFPPGLFEPSANGVNGQAPPSANGVYGAPPSRNGHQDSAPPSANGRFTMPNPVG